MQGLRPRSVLTSGRALLAAAGTFAFAMLAIAIPGFAEPGGGAATLRTQSSVVVPVAVFGTDERVALPPNLRPYREMLGVLFNVRQRTVCSAFCVAPNLIGTAAHCLYKTNGEKAPRLSDFWFARNYDAVRDYARVAGYETSTTAQNVIAGSTDLSTSPPIDATRDWAFIRLSAAVCSKGTFEIETLSVDKIIQESKAGRVYQLSYHKDFKQWQPAYSTPCLVDRSFSNVPWPTIAADFDTPENLLLHTCDTGGASSGSPLLLDTAQGPKVIGINVGTYVQSRTVLHQSRPADKPSSDSIANTGVASAAFARQLASFRNARILVGSSTLRELQERLQKIGYYYGPIDGTYGPALKLAIDSYEASANLPKTGLASEDLLARLRTGTAATLPVVKTR